MIIFQWWSEGSRNSYTERNDCRHRNHLRYLRSLRNHRGLMLYQVRTFNTYVLFLAFLTLQTQANTKQWFYNRDASGVPEEVTFGTDAFNETAGQILNISLRFDNCDLALRGGNPCVKGSANDQQLLEVISAWGPLIYVGCFAATLRLDIKILMLTNYAIFIAITSTCMANLN